MANRYWVGGTGTWDASNTANWSTASGGAGGASVPTTADVVIFNTSSGTGTVSLSGSLSCSTFSFVSSTLSISAGTSTLTCASSGAQTFAGGGQSYYDVSFTGGSNGAITITGTNSFNNLSFTASSVSNKNVLFSDTQVINGVLSTSGVTGYIRITFKSSSAGVQKTLSLANTPNVNGCNFTDIIISGAASPWTAPAGVWDYGNNSNITFYTGSLYWVNAAGNWNDGSHWATSSGGTAISGAAPASYNDAIFDGSSSVVLSSVTVNTTAYCRSLSVLSTAKISIIASTSDRLFIYGSLTLGGSGTFNTCNPSFSATTTGHTITTNGKTLAGSWFRGVGGEWSLQDNYSGSYILVENGSFITNNYNLSLTGSFSSNYTTARSISLGSSNVTVGGGNPITFSETNLTFNAGTSTITTLQNSGVDLNFGNQIFYNLVVPGIYPTTSSPVRFYNPNTFNNLTLSTPTSEGTRSYLFGANVTINGTLTVSNSGNYNYRALIYGSSAITITANVVSLTAVDFLNITGAGTASWSGTSIGNVQGNSGITFSTPKSVYRVGAGNWYASNVWATSPGGATSNANFPIPQDTAYFVDTGLASGSTINVGGQYGYFSAIDFSGRTLPMTFNFNNPAYVCGNVTWDANVTCSGTGGMYFFQTPTLTSAGVTLTTPVGVVSGATLSLADALNTSSSVVVDGTFSPTYSVTCSGLTIGAGGVFTQNTTLTCSGALTNNGTFTPNTNNSFTACTLGAASTTNFGTNKILLTGNNATIFTGNATQTVTGTPVIDCTYSGATGTRTITGAGTEANAISFNITAGTDSVTVGGSIKDLNFTGFAGTNTGGLGTIYGDLTLSTGMTLTLTGSATTFAGTSGTKTITSNGKTINGNIFFNGIGATWQLADNMSVNSSRLPSLYAGTLDLNGKTLSCNNFSVDTANPKNITFNGGTISASGLFTIQAAAANFTTTAGTGTGKISMTSASAKTFAGGGVTYNCTLEQAGAGALTITGSNTFNNITNTTQPVSVLFTAGTTNTFNNFSLSGTSGNLVTIGSPTAASHTLSKSSGVVDVSYCTISRSTATGGAIWESLTTNGNVDGGNNSGWIFSYSSGNGLLFGSNF